MSPIGWVALSTGSFHITKIDPYRDSTNTLRLADFAAMFVLFDDGNLNALNGSVTFQSSVVPEPSAVVLLGVGMACVASFQAILTAAVEEEPRARGLGRRKGEKIGRIDRRESDE